MSGSAENAAVPARPAATLIWVRANKHGAPEVLLMKRNARSRFMPNAYVFAGGAVDVEDCSQDGYALSPHLDDRTASARLGVPLNGLGFYVAAVRESFEECGLLLGCNEGGDTVAFEAWSDAQLVQARNAVGAKTRSFGALCQAYRWRLALERLFYFAHWITPEGLPRRFDTRFFIARAPEGQRASLASDEMSGLIWRTPQQALSDQSRGEVTLMKATRAMLTDIAAFEGADALIKFACVPRVIDVVRPVLGSET